MYVFTFEKKGEGREIRLQRGYARLGGCGLR